MLRIKTYIERMSDGALGNFPTSSAAVNKHRQTVPDEMSEFMIMGLRLTQEGVSSERFRERFGCGLTDTYAPQLAELIALGLLEWCPADADTIRLTNRGHLLGNQVFMRFV